MFGCEVGAEEIVVAVVAVAASVVAVVALIASVAGMVAGKATRNSIMYDIHRGSYSW